MLNSFINSSNYSTSLRWLVLGVINIGMLIGCSIQPPRVEDPTLGPYQVDTTTPIVLPSQSCHQVKTGDNLYRIGLKYGASYEQLAKWNGLTVSRWDGDKPVYDLAPGQRLKVSSYAVCY